MILTKKTKEDFLKWVYSEYDYKYDHLKDFYPLHLLDGLIIEWFDSVGIYVSTDYVVIDDSTLAFVYSIVKYLKEGKGRKKDSWDFIEKTESFNGYNMDYYADRQEATQQAIKKANEIYNIQQYNLRNSL